MSTKWPEIPNGEAVREERAYCVGTCHQRLSGEGVTEVPNHPEIPASSKRGQKNHSFIDGNKRIAAALFLWFLERNRILYRVDGTKRIAENALVAMTLLIAESRPTEKDIITRVVANLLNKKNS